MRHRRGDPLLRPVRSHPAGRGSRPAGRQHRTGGLRPRDRAAADSRTAHHGPVGRGDHHRPRRSGDDGRGPHPRQGVHPNSRTCRPGCRGPTPPSAGALPRSARHQRHPMARRRARPARYRRPGGPRHQQRPRRHREAGPADLPDRRGTSRSHPRPLPVRRRPAGERRHRHRSGHDRTSLPPTGRSACGVRTDPAACHCARVGSSRRNRDLRSDRRDPDRSAARPRTHPARLRHRPGRRRPYCCLAPRHAQHRHTSPPPSPSRRPAGHPLDLVRPARLRRINSRRRERRCVGSGRHRSRRRRPGDRPIRGRWPFGRRPPRAGLRRTAAPARPCGAQRGRFGAVRRRGARLVRGHVPAGTASLRAATNGRSAKESYESTAEYDPTMFTPADHAALDGPGPGSARSCHPHWRTAPVP